MKPTDCQPAGDGGVVSSAGLGVSRERLEYRIGKWKDERANKQREPLQIKTEIDVLERTIAEMEDIINDKRNLPTVRGQ